MAEFLANGVLQAEDDGGLAGLGGTDPGPLDLLSAVSLNSTVVGLTFSRHLHPDFATHVNPANYVITPSLTVNSVTYGIGVNQVRLFTAPQSLGAYSLTVGDALSIAGSSLVIDTALFSGNGATPSFFATAQGPRKIVLNFSEAMMQDGAFTTAANYSVIDIHGASVPVITASPQGNASISRVTLTLGADLTSWGHYVATVSPMVKTVSGLTIYPDTSLFQWADMSGVVTRGPLVIPMASFSGEISGGLHGTPAGQIFFSPALTTAAANSIIQVEEVACCTRAFDVYSFPNPPDPIPFFTFGNAASVGSLGSTATVLWGPAHLLGQAKVEVSDFREELLEPPVDTVATIILREPIDITTGGFLNDSRWHMYDGLATTFTTANNLAPIGPGPTTAIVYPADSVVVPDSLTPITNYVRAVTADAVSAADAVQISIEIGLAGDSVATVDDVTAETE